MKSWNMRTKNKDGKFNPQDTFLSLLNSTGNLFSFVKEIDHNHIRSQFACLPTKSQGTTNAATIKGTISPQSTNFLQNSKSFHPNKKTVSEYSSNWEEAFNSTTHHKAANKYSYYYNL